MIFPVYEEFDPEPPPTPPARARFNRPLDRAEQADAHGVRAARALGRAHARVEAVAAAHEGRGVRGEVADEDAARRVALLAGEVPRVRGERDAGAVRGDGRVAGRAHRRWAFGARSAR